MARSGFTRRREMKKLGIGLLIAAAVLLLLVAIAGTVFYVRVYKPIGSPLMAMAGGKTLEEKRLQNHAEFTPPISRQVTAEQTADFVAVEEAVEKNLGTNVTVLAPNQADLERASTSNALSVRTTLLAFGNIKPVYLNAKTAQIDAMNRARFSKAEFEWVRRQLYSAAGLHWSQLDVSEVLEGLPDAAVKIRQFEPSRDVPEQNEQLARPHASKLQAWIAFAFFGL
jgi:uncharacterized membrane protein